MEAAPEGDPASGRSLDEPSDARRVLEARIGRENYGAVRAAVYAIGGWEDGYTNTILRLMRNLKAPRKALIGPWEHTYPHVADVNPIGFLQDATRWWDHWLKDCDTGIMDEPMIRAWMQESAPPKPVYAHRPGRWIAERDWPSTSTKPLRLLLGDGTLRRKESGARDVHGELAADDRHRRRHLVPLRRARRHAGRPERG